MVSISSKVALAVGITLSIAAISSIFVTTVAAQNMSNSGGISTSQPTSPTTTANATGSNMTVNGMTVSMVKGAADPGNGKFFVPPEISVSTGTTIMWTNDDVAAHTVTSGNPSSGPSGQFDSGSIAPNAKFTHTFNNPGTIDYYCTFHPWMTGKVTAG